VAKIYHLVLSELAPLATNGNGKAHTAEDKLLTVQEASARLGVGKRWLYVHAADFPFTVRLPGRRLRFREVGLARYLQKQAA
jgi:predicted DNA-binding transcriptional regulator AlpA